MASVPARSAHAHPHPHSHSHFHGSAPEPVPVYVYVIDGYLRSSRSPMVTSESTALYVGSEATLGGWWPRGVTHAGPTGKFDLTRVRDSIAKPKAVTIAARALDGSPIPASLPDHVIVEVDGCLLVHKFRCVSRDGFAVFDHWGVTNSVVTLHK